MSKRSTPSTAEMYRALVDRDPSYDGVFIVGVKTTGIFCRPVCPARKPKPENVEFFANVAEAQKSGYRACKRCAPTAQPDEPPAWIHSLMQAVDRDPTAPMRDRDLRDQHLSPHRVRRYFQEHHGMTFQAYARARRVGLALLAVQSGEDLLEAGMQHGFESDSGFRDAFARVLGTTPGGSRDVACLLAHQISTPLGPMLAVANDRGLAMLEFVDRKAMDAQVATLRRWFPEPVVPGRNACLDQVEDELARYFAGTLKDFTVELVMPGSPFQQAVWSALRQIPHGGTTSYKSIAASVGRPGASQAVGRANGENRLAIVIPCHRVVRTDGHLCGYAGGLARKQWLLDHERQTAGSQPLLFPEITQRLEVQA